MVYLTGDTHGWIDIHKLRRAMWPEGGRLTRDDLLVILGDFGMYWEPTLRGRLKGCMDWLESQPWTTLWLDGNHENHAVVAAEPVAEMFGGTVGTHPRYPHVVHLRRGEAYDLPLGGGATASVWVMGGARSVDRAWRVPGESWWPGELPSSEEMGRGLRTLAARGWRVDYVLTHDCPHRIKREVLGWRDSWGEGPDEDPLDLYLDGVDERAAYGRWYFGHHHVDRSWHGGRYACLFQQVVPLGGLPGGPGGGEGRLLVEPSRASGLLDLDEVAEEMRLEGADVSRDEAARAMARCECVVEPGTGRPLFRAGDLAHVRRWASRHRRWRGAGDGR